MIIKLNVPYEEKDEAKALGACWDRRHKFWFIDHHAERSKFTKWIDENSEEKEKPVLYFDNPIEGVIEFDEKNKLIIKTTEGSEIDMDQLKRSLKTYEGWKINIKVEE